MPAPRQQPTLDLGELIGEFERKLDRLKMLYEQYFMGIEKREPTVPLKDVVRIMREIDQQQIRNTGLRFRFRTLVQKFNTYKTYWHRTLRAIENGTYQRDIARLGRSLARKGIAMPQLGRAASPAEVERAMAAAAHRAAGGINDTDKVAALPEPAPTALAASPTEPGVPAALRQPSPRPSGEGRDEDEDEETNPGQRGLPRVSADAAADAGAAPRRAGPAVPAQRAQPAAGQSAIPESELRSLYRRFVKAKQMCGEDASGIRYESLAKSISQQLPKIQAQHQGREVEFQVVIREGRAILRAKPK